MKSKTKNKKKKTTPHYVDPLYQLFEHNLFHRSYDDIGAFTREVAEEYLAYLDSTKAHVPFAARANLLKELENEAHEMLVKKMYGCSSPKDYFNLGKVEAEKTETEPELKPKRRSKKKSAHKED